MTHSLWAPRAALQPACEILFLHSRLDLPKVTGQPDETVLRAGKVLALVLLAFPASIAFSVRGSHPSLTPFRPPPAHPVPKKGLASDLGPQIEGQTLHPPPIYPPTVFSTSEHFEKCCPLLKGNSCIIQQGPRGKARVSSWRRISLLLWPISLEGGLRAARFQTCSLDGSLGLTPN